MGLIVWFKTDFLAHLFGTIYDVDLDSSNVNEFVVLRFSNPIFKTRFTTAGLITCPFCLGVWVATALSIFVGPAYLPAIYLGQLLIFRLFLELFD